MTLRGEIEYCDDTAQRSKIIPNLLQFMLQYVDASKQKYFQCENVLKFTIYKSMHYLLTRVLSVLLISRNLFRLNR